MRGSLTAARRPLFVATILLGSFLLFLVQPMVARLALPELGGSPNVWNSAMLVYQALLLGGYGYAHLLGKLPPRRQGAIHIGLFLLAALTLPVSLADLPAAGSGREVLWVPLLLALSIGPVFLVVSAQAPLMQRWFAASPDAGAPWALYAASNLGSFGGLIAYPLLAEPLLTLDQQSKAWSAGYAVLLVLVALCAWSRRNAAAPVNAAATEPRAPIPLRRVLLWLALSAVPSGLMLSTTTHITTDILAAPLLWVIPLGLYLLSFSVAFADRRMPARGATLIAPVVMVFAGSYAMLSTGVGGIWGLIGPCALLFCAATALHSRLYDLRPEAGDLTRFYFVMALGGALGGLFTALIAPLVFDWVWEHPLLVLAAAALMPLEPLLRWYDRDRFEPAQRRLVISALVMMAIFLSWELVDFVTETDGKLAALVTTVFLVGIDMMLTPFRPLFVLLLAMVMVAQGGVTTVIGTWWGSRTRSYFGIYDLREDAAGRQRYLVHGTTLHGKQSTIPGEERELTSYYGPTSGVGLAFGALPDIYGAGARVGVVGLGTGTLACHRRPGQHWTFFEIDPVIERFSRRGVFTFLRDCAPDARVVIGDARLQLEKTPPGSFDALAIDAFSSDSIPLHLLTEEAVAVYERALTKDGILLIHISNRYIDLEPVLAGIARRRGMAALERIDPQQDSRLLTTSLWVALARDPEVLKRLRARRPNVAWKALDPPSGRVWTDDYASILPYIRWQSILEL